MKRLERVLWIIVLIGAALKVFHLPFSSFLLIIGLSTLNIIYFLFAWLLFPVPERKDQLVWLSVLGGIALSVALMAILFKIQLWPLSGFYLMIAVTTLPLLVISTLIVRSSRPDLAGYTRGMLARTLPVLVVCVLLQLLPGGTLTAFYYRNDPELAPYAIQRNTATDPIEQERLSHQMDSIEQARALRSLEVKRTSSH